MRLAGSRRCNRDSVAALDRTERSPARLEHWQEEMHVVRNRAWLRLTWLRLTKGAEAHKLKRVLVFRTVATPGGKLLNNPPKI